jgi:multiple sugar transport system permease protein
VVAQYAFGAVVFVFFAFPIVWTVLLSFKTDNDAWVTPPKWLFTPTLDQYVGLFNAWPFLTYYGNSFVVLCGSLLVSVALGVPLAYALARFPIRRKNDLSFFILSQLMMPPAAVIVPFYLIADQLGILKTLWAPILVYIAFTLPFIAWIMKGFFDTLPVSIEEAALVDGASHFQVFWYVVLPLVLGSLSSTVMLASITIWNEFFFALVMTGASTYTVPVSIIGLWTQYTVFWGQIAAGGVLISLPIVAMGLAVQRYLVRGLTLGAVK